MIPAANNPLTVNDVPFTVQIPAHPLTRPLIAVRLSNESPVILSITVGPTPIVLPPFAAINVALDGTEQAIAVTPLSPLPKFGLLSVLFLEPADVDLGNFQRSAQYIPPVRRVFAAGTGLTGNQTFGPFDVSDYEKLVISVHTSSSTGASADMQVVVTWFDAPNSGRVVASVTYTAPAVAVADATDIIDTLTNLGPIATIQCNAGGATPLYNATFTGIGNVSVNNQSVSSNVLLDSGAQLHGAPAGNTLVTTDSRLIRACSAYVTWFVPGAALFQIFLHSSSGSFIFAIDQAKGNNGTLPCSIPSVPFTASFANGDGVARSANVTVVPAFS